MEIKYEGVFGDQSLFDDTINEDALIVLAHNSYKVFFQNIEGAFQWIRQDTSHRSKCIDKYAMRRVIRTPTWTIADQKAGKLPEVGCKVFVKSTSEVGCIVALNNNIACILFDDGAFVTVCVKSDIKPIESPEEKAAQLRAEWYTKAREIYRNSNSDFKAVYDALLSGDLPVPVKVN